MPYPGLQATDGVPIPLCGVSIGGEVVGGYAHIRIRQRYQHTEHKPVETVYTFPMPADATLVGFAIMSARLQSAQTSTPRLAQAIAVLQLQRADLEALIDKELNENPFLERVEEVSQAMQASLDPKPGRRVSPPGGHQLRPDVEVRKEGEMLVARLNEEGFPQLQINSAAYERLLTTKDGQGKTTMQDKLHSATWLIKSIEQARRALLQVAQSIVTFQHDFLSDGVSPIQPLAVQDVAADVGLHTSTVRPAIANKYMATPWGIFPLEKFCRMSRNGQNTEAGSTTEMTSPASLATP